MSRTHRILLPLMCFCLSWGVTRHFADRKSAPAAAGKSSITRTPATAPQTVNSPTDPKALAARFIAASTVEWPELWAEFAESAKAEDMESLSQLKPGRNSWMGDDGTRLLAALAEEELALRGEKLPATRHGAAALAEHDPEKAWQAVQQARASMVSSAVLRMIAIRDPKAALAKWKTLGPERGPDWTGENDVIHSPLGSIFAAWTRRDPSAAIAAAEELRSTDRLTALREIALTLTYQDGPAGVKFILANSLAEGCRIDAALRAAFGQSAGASRAVAALLAEHPNLLASTGFFIGPWYGTDPEGARAWVLANSDINGGRHLLFHLDQQFSLAQIAAAPAKQQDAHYLSVLYYHAPDQVKALAEKRGIWPDVEERIRQTEGTADPAAPLRGMLDRIKEHGPDQVLAASPADTAHMDSYLECARRFLPEAVAVLESVTVPERPRQPGRYMDGSPIPPEDFAYDPAATARKLQENPVSTWDAWHCVRQWAPYDFQAAKAWVATLPEGAAKDRAEAALLKFDPGQSGEAIAQQMLAADFSSFRRDGVHSVDLQDIAEAWDTGLTRMARSGGDWRGLYAKIPAAWREDGVTRSRLEGLRERLEQEEAVLKALK